jgi:cysteine sulfinate desulfinase/cysteine desulfurase-like protein
MTNVVITGGTTFCTATTIQADEFAALTAGDAIFISSGGKSRPATINTPNTSGIATLGAACTDCPATTTTTSTTSTQLQLHLLVQLRQVQRQHQLQLHQLLQLLVQQLQPQLLIDIVVLVK